MLSTYSCIGCSLQLCMLVVVNDRSVLVYRQVVQANSKLVDISKKCDEEKKKLKQHLTNSTLVS